MRGAFWWIDRWRQSRAFTDMTAEEQGLARNLWDELWLRDDHVIPDDPRILAKVSGDPEAWGRCGARVLKWMKRVDGGWTHGVALEVIADSKKRAAKQKRYREKSRNQPGNASGNGTGNPAASLGSVSVHLEKDKDPEQAAALPRTELASSRVFPDNRPNPEREAYVREVWSEWCSKRGGELPVPSPAELDLARALYEDGVPLRVALRAITDCSKPPRGVRTPLQYVEPAFHEAARHWRKSMTA